ncbi:MAG: mechanosensitive ion channel [Candidatus Mariimomonas ferrooxydans]
MEGAGILLLIAFAVASVLRLVVSKVLSTTKLDERLSSKAGIEEEKRIPLTKSISDTLYWLVFLLFLPAVLSTLGVEGLLGPVKGLLNKVLAFLPNIFTAVLILAAGWFAARIVQRIVTNLLAAVGSDQLSEKVGLTGLLGERRLSGLLGTIVYIFILIPVIIATLNALTLEAITRPTSNMLNIILAAIPDIFAASLVLAVAYVVGRIVSNLIATLLAGIGFNKILAKLGIGKESEEGKWTPSSVVGTIALIAIMLFATVEASALLGFAELADMVSQFMVFAGHIVFGLVIFAIGLFLANLASKAILATETAQAWILSMTSRIAIIVLTGAMALRQMGLANEIINLAFGILLGAIAVAAAIAFGIGGREIASRKLEEWSQSGESKES